MFERLIDLLIQLWDRAAPAFIVSAYQTAGVMRFGRYHRTCPPGFHWKIPFVEEAMEVLTTQTTIRLPAQTVTTSDGKPIVASAMVKYSVVDVKPYVTEITDQHDVLADVSCGAIRTAVREMSTDQLFAEPPERRVLELVRRQVKEYGFKVHTVTFIDLAAVKTIRLIAGNVPLSLDN